MSSFKISLSFKGKNVDILDATTALVPNELYEKARNALEIPQDAKLKLLYKGKRLDESNVETAIFTSLPNKKPKILVIASAADKVGQVESRKSDPTIRGFTSEREQEESRTNQRDAGPWGGALSGQDKDFKFCRFQHCTDQSFGHRPTESTPHAFEALQLLEKLATDPGVVAIMKERELVVGTLGEMDPIDDRLMQKTEEHGGCLLGYNTNHGLRIDMKLRSDDLSQFRPYPQLVTTLIHELSHNWVGDHNLLFWTNYGQMRAEYLYTHAKLRATVVHGKTPSAIAGLPGNLTTDKVFDTVMTELVQEMRQHGLHPQMIAVPIQQRCEELFQSLEQSQRLGGATTTETTNMTARELALLAAERRARQQKESRKSGDT